jgi:hypothetical protein
VLSSFGPNIDDELDDAKTTLGANGGRILLPRGDLEINDPPAFNETRNIILEGGAGVTAGAAASTQVTYTGTGDRAIDARSSFGFKLRDLQLLYDQAGFTGQLVDFSQSIVQDAAFGAIDNCYLGGAGVSGATLLKLTNAICCTFENAIFSHGAYHVRGLTATPGDYSNAMKFDGCVFKNAVTRAVAAAGEAWKFDGCTFQQLQNGNCGAYLQDQGTALDLSFLGCWFGDGNTSGNWLHHAGHGFVVKGCRMQNGNNGIVLSNGSKGIDIAGNTLAFMTNGINIGSGCSGTFWPNRYSNVTNPIVDGGTLASSTLGITASGTNGDGEIVLRGQVHAPQGIHLLTKAGVPTDADFPTDRPPESGLVGCVDTTNSRLYIRVGSTWKYAALT